MHVRIPSVRQVLQHGTQGTYHVASIRQTQSRRMEVTEETIIGFLCSCSGEARASRERRYIAALRFECLTTFSHLARSLRRILKKRSGPPPAMFTPSRAARAFISGVSRNRFTSLFQR